MRAVDFNVYIMLFCVPCNYESVLKGGYDPGLPTFEVVFGSSTHLAVPILNSGEIKFGNSLLQVCIPVVDVPCSSESVFGTDMIWDLAPLGLYAGISHILQITSYILDV